MKALSQRVEEGGGGWRSVEDRGGGWRRVGCGVRAAAGGKSDELGAQSLHRRSSSTSRQGLSPLGSGPPCMLGSTS